MYFVAFKKLGEEIKKGLFAFFKKCDVMLEKELLELSKTVRKGDFLESDERLRDIADKMLR